MSLETQRREQLITHLEQQVRQAGLSAPAILLLETLKPLAYLGAQIMWAAQPFLNVKWGDQDLREIALLLEDQAGVEILIERLESSPPIS